MWVCKCTELCLWSGGYFLPLIGIATGLGCCLLGLDKDAVCGPLLGACVAAWTEGLTHRWRDEWGGVMGGYIYLLVTPVQTSKHGDIPELFYCWFPTMSLHSVTGLRGFLTGTLPFCVLIPYKVWIKTALLLKWSMMMVVCKRLISIHTTWVCLNEIQQYVEDKKKKVDTCLKLKDLEKTSEKMTAPHRLNTPCSQNLQHYTDSCEHQKCQQN